MSKYIDYSFLENDIHNSQHTHMYIYEVNIPVHNMVYRQICTYKLNIQRNMYIILHDTCYNAFICTCIYFGTGDGSYGLD